MADLDSRRIEHYSMILGQVVDDNSRKERRAEEAERDVEKLKKVNICQLTLARSMTDLSQELAKPGNVQELPNTERLCERGRYARRLLLFFQEDYAMIGEDTGKQYAIGDPIQIKVKNTDKMTKSIDFSIVYKGEDTFVKGKRKHSHRK